MRADEITKVIRSYDPRPWREGAGSFYAGVDFQEWYDTLKDTMLIMVVEVELDRCQAR